MRYTFVAPALVVISLLAACGGSDPESAPSATAPPKVSRPVTVEMKVVESATPPPEPTAAPEEFVEAYNHHVESPPPVVAAAPRPGPAAPAAPVPPPPADRPIAELLHPPPYTVFVDAGHGTLDSGAANQGLQEKNVNLDA